MQRDSSNFLEFGGGSIGILTSLRVRLLQIVLSFAFIISLLGIFVRVTTEFTFFEVGSLVAPIAAAIALIGFVLVSNRYFLTIIGVLSITFLTVVSIGIFVATENIAVLLVFMSFISLVAALLFNRFVFYPIMTMLVLVIISIAFISSNQIQFIDDANIAFVLLLTMGGIPVGISAIARYFIITMEATTKRAQRSASLLAASADIGRNVSQMLDLNVLLDRAVEIMRDRFAFYHVSVFLLDDQERYAHLTASTGEIGEQMLARGHRLPINAESVVGRSAQAQDIIIARDTDSESGHTFNDLLPFTRSELAVPIVDNNGIVGVVDIQSRRPDAFSSTEIESLRVIANQLATAIRNARLFEDKERSIRENKRLFIEAETNLREIQRLNRQLTKQAWQDYLRTDRRVDGVTLRADTFSNSAEWSEEMIDASLRRRAILGEEDGKRTVAVPIELRGEVVGAIELETELNNKKDDLVDMVRAVSQRLAVSLDNARLFEESNEATAQEQRISEIVSQYQSVESVDELLRVTLQGLAETLGAEQASIRLGAVPDIEQEQIESASLGIADNNGHDKNNGGASNVQ